MIHSGKRAIRILGTFANTSSIQFICKSEKIQGTSLDLPTSVAMRCSVSNQQIDCISTELPKMSKHSWHSFTCFPSGPSVATSPSR